MLDVKAKAKLMAGDWDVTLPYGSWINIVAEGGSLFVRYFVISLIVHTHMCQLISVLTAFSNSAGSGESIHMHRLSSTFAAPNTKHAYR